MRVAILFAQLTHFSPEEQTHHRCTNCDSKRLWDDQGCYAYTNHISSRICEQFTPNNVLNVHQVAKSINERKDQRESSNWHIIQRKMMTRITAREHIHTRFLLNFRFWMLLIERFCVSACEQLFLADHWGNPRGPTKGFATAMILGTSLR